MIRLSLIAVLLICGCSSKPQQVEIIVKNEKQEMTPEQKAEEARLKKLNDLNGPANDAYVKLVDDSQKLDGDNVLRFTEALSAFDTEHVRLKEDTSHDGQLKAAQFFHDELVGKSMDEFIAKWAPKKSP